ncbi:hypothetical protein EQP59_05470 [Ornithobacterium rhinotracheale]|uniref:Uncharacterized protein n=3 Tax=Ornithobacterium rhinotracheale TaxID=28251 RepID=A0A410JRP0_ORNRH|nr:hypothetical protein [Ornithobacterium rhinotracheale]QAR30823.1 hypothetical protein EQP59_05470 [Ornithobacterium rhinotracheale]
MNSLSRYFCSESVEIASNDIYRECINKLDCGDSTDFENIKIMQERIKIAEDLNEKIYFESQTLIQKKLEFIIRKTFYRKFFRPTHSSNNPLAMNVKRALNQNPIILLGGGANFNELNNRYIYSLPTNYKDNPLFLEPNRVSDYLENVGDAVDGFDEIDNNVKNLLILSLGLSYIETGSNYIPFTIEHEWINEENLSTDFYNYYDIQEAVYK